MAKHRIEITVKPKAVKAKSKAKPQKPLIRIGGSPDVLSRRSSNAIRFYDLGQIKSGSTWASIDVQIAPTLLGASGTTPPSIRTTILSDYQAVSDTFIGESGTWQSVFRPIAKNGGLETNSKITAIGATFNDFLASLPSSVWTGAGLVVQQSDLDFGISIASTNGFCEAVKLKDDGTHKITTSPSFSAPAAAFIPAKKMDVFLVPALIVPNTQDGTVDGSGFTYAEAAGYFITTIYRPMLFDTGNTHYFAFNLPFATAWTGFYYILQYIKSQANAKGARLDFTPDVWSVVSPLSIPNIGLLPVPPTEPLTGVGGPPRYDSVAGYGPYQGVFEQRPAYDVSGSLVAVVIKSGIKYYFWTP